jgi:hypothetical protein
LDILWIVVLNRESHGRKRGHFERTAVSLSSLIEDEISQERPPRAWPTRSKIGGLLSYNVLLEKSKFAILKFDGAGGAKQAVLNDFRSPCRVDDSDSDIILTS